jgi:hypothetical protein
MLPKALSDALGIGLSEVLGHYYSVSDLVERSRLIGEALDRRRMEEEGEEWLAKEARKWNALAELVHIGGEMIPIRVERDLLNGFLFDWCP